MSHLKLSLSIGTILYFLTLIQQVTLFITYNLPNNTTILKKTFCDEFCQNILDLDARTKSIRVVYEDALFNCTVVLAIDLQNNLITHLSKNTFKTNIKLKRLNLSNNCLRSLEFGLFNGLQMLEYIRLDKNFIKYLPVSHFKSLRNLGGLYIFNNELVDLDVNELAKYLPELYLISIGNNEFQCDRLEDMLTVIKNQKWQMYTNSYDTKVRNYPIELRNKLECISSDTINMLWNESGNVDDHIMIEVLKQRIELMNNSLPTVRNMVNKKLDEFEKSINYNSVVSKIVLLENKINNLKNTNKDITNQIHMNMDELKNLCLLTIIVMSVLICFLTTFGITWLCDKNMFKALRK